MRHFIRIISDKEYYDHYRTINLIYLHPFADFFEFEHSNIYQLSHLYWGWIRVGYLD